MNEINVQEYEEVVMDDRLLFFPCSAPDPHISLWLNLPKTKSNLAASSSLRHSVLVQIRQHPPLQQPRRAGAAWPPTGVLGDDFFGVATSGVLGVAFPFSAVQTHC